MFAVVSIIVALSALIVMKNNVALQHHRFEIMKIRMLLEDATEFLRPSPLSIYEYDDDNGKSKLEA